MKAARAAVRLAAGAIAAAWILGGGAGPAAADNCSGLSDCYFVSRSAVTVTVGLGTVAIVLLLTPPIGGSPDVKPLDPNDVPPPKEPPGGGPPDPKLSGSPEVVKVAGPDGTVVDRPVKAPRPPEEEAIVRTKVREAEQAVVKLPRPRQKAIFEEEALAAGQDQRFKELAGAIKAGAPPEQLLQAVNPTGDRTNTAATVSAVDAALDKVPRIAKPGGAVNAETLAAIHDTVVTQVADLGEVDAFLAKAGPGARGIVTVQVDLAPSWTNPVPVRVGHAFNAANVEGRIVFLDGQTGAVVGTPQELLAAAGHDPATVSAVRFVPTHPTLSG